MVLAQPLEVRNVVCNASVEAKIPVHWLTIAIDGRLGDTIFPACVSLCRNPKTTNSVFASGQIVIAGAKSAEDALLSAVMLVGRMRTVMDRTDLFLNHFFVQNIVCSGHTGYELDIDLFFTEQKVYCTYDPELFTGLTYRTPETDTEPGMGFVLFKSGAVLAAGLKTVEQRELATTKLEILSRYRKGDRQSSGEGRTRTKKRPLAKKTNRSSKKIKST